MVRKINVGLMLPRFDKEAKDAENDIYISCEKSPSCDDWTNIVQIVSRSPFVVPKDVEGKYLGHDSVIQKYRGYEKELELYHGVLFFPYVFLKWIDGKSYSKGLDILAKSNDSVLDFSRFVEEAILTYYKFGNIKDIVGQV